MPETPTSKEAFVLKLLSEGDTMLCLDARHQGVRVPPQHAENHALRLVLNLNFPQPIEVTAEGVSANLAFGGRRYPCYIPHAALWAVFNPETMQGMMWPDSMPEEVKADFAARQQAGVSAPSPEPTPTPASRTPRKPTPPRSRVRPAEPPRPEPAAPEESGTPAPPRQRGHLRIVK